MATDRLTFAQFQATGRDVADLRDTLDFFSDRALYPDAMPGRVYDGDLYLHTNPDEVAPFCVEIANFSRIGALATCEAELYAFYLSECADRDVAAYLRDLAPANDFWPKEADTEESLAELLTAFCHFHGLPQESACDLRHRDEVTIAQAEWLNAFIDRWDAVVDAEWKPTPCQSCGGFCGDKGPTCAELAQNPMLGQPGVINTPAEVAAWAQEKARIEAAQDAEEAARAELIAAAHRADGDERPNRPERAPGYSDAEWTAFLRGWDAHAEAVYASGLRAALAALPK